jgi:signal transduction histidine kinase
MRWRIRSQLLLPLVLLLLGVAGTTVWTAAASARQARRQIETRLRNVARLLSEELSWPLNREVLRKMKALSGADYVHVPPNDSPPASSLDDVPADLPGKVEVGDDWQGLRLGPRVEVYGEAYLCSGIRLRGVGSAGGGTLYILYPESLWRDARWGAIWPSLVLGGLLGPASVGLALALGQRLSRRVRELERRTRLIAAGDFSPMPLPGRDDEVRDLARSVNEMAGRLAQLQKTVERTERLRLLGQVSGGLAHQLRNGLTGARLAVQLYLSESSAADAAPLEVALRQLTLLEAHLKRFLDLGRAGPSRREPCSLTALVGESVALVAPQCRHAGIALRWDPPADPHTLPGDPGQLGQLVLNLLNNAVDAAGPGGEVEIRMTNAQCPMTKSQPPATPARDGAGGSQSGGGGSSLVIGHSSLVILEVFDSGPGPAKDVAERLFEPFVTGKPEGVGLGLAVARQVAEGHGGRIGWSRAGGRTCFRVELPRGGVGGEGKKADAQAHSHRG